MTTTQEQTFRTPAPVELTVANGSGSVSVTARDGDTTVVRVNGHRADETRIEQDGDHVVVVAPRSHGRFTRDSKLDVEVTLPTSSRVAVKVGSADVVTTGLLAAVQARAGSGDVTLDEVDAAYVESGSGDVRVRACSDALAVKTGSGDVVVDHVGGATSVSTGSGDVTVEMLEATARIKSGSGDVTVGVPEELPVWTELSTAGGRVRTTVEGPGAPAAGAHHVELSVTTASGDIDLRPAAVVR